MQKGRSAEWREKIGKEVHIGGRSAEKRAECRKQGGV